jgi:hypothetical protein
MKSVSTLQDELERKKAHLKAVEARVTYSDKKLKLKKRELRDQVRYALGGLILDHNICEEFVGLKERLYELAMTRDKKKLVEQGFSDGSIPELKQLNKKECKASAKKAGNNSPLSPEEETQLKQALEENVYKKVYGRKDEFFVFTGDNIKFYISDNVGKYLQENEGFKT